MLAIKMGKGFTGQKPLTHTVAEARALRMAAREHKRRHTDGQPGTAENGLRRGVEVVQSGALGKVSENPCLDQTAPIWPQAPQIMAELPRAADPPDHPLGHVPWPGLPRGHTTLAINFQLARLVGTTARAHSATWAATPPIWLHGQQAGIPDQLRAKPVI